MHSPLSTPKHLLPRPLGQYLFKIHNTNNTKNIGLTALERRVEDVLQFCPIDFHIGAGNAAEKLDNITGVIKVIVILNLQKLKEKISCKISDYSD